MAAPVLVATNSAFNVNSVSGLETTLFSGLLLSGLVLQLRVSEGGRQGLSGVAFGLAALTRPEGLLAFTGAIAGKALGGGWKNRRFLRAALPDVAAFTTLVGAFVIFRWLAYDRELLPNTFYAKATGGSDVPGAAGYLWDFAWLHLGGPTALVAFLPFTLRRGPSREATMPAVSVCALAVLALFWTGPDWMIGYRILVPYMPIWAALGLWGTVALAERSRLPLRPAAWGGDRTSAFLGRFVGSASPRVQALRRDPRPGVRRRALHACPVARSSSCSGRYSRSHGYRSRGLSVS